MVPTITPTQKQHLAWEALKNRLSKFVFFGGGAGGGKSWLGCEWLITNCYLFPGSRWFIGRNELKRLTQSTFITFQKVCKFHNIPREDWHLDGKYNVIRFANGSTIDLLDLKYLPAEDPLYERFGSLEYTGGWIEEAGEVHFGAFDVLKSRVGRHLNKELNIPAKLLATCNPKKNWVYRLVYRPWREGTLSASYEFIRSLYLDNPHTAKEYAEQLNEITDTSTKQRLKEGNWEYDDSSNALMTYDALVDIFLNTAKDNRFKFMTVDVSRFGGDRIVKTCWQGLRAYKMVVSRKRSTTTTEDEIKELASNESIPIGNICIDEDGIGGGIVDHIEGVRGFVANRTPYPNPITLEPENYKNLKAQCAYKLAELINKRMLSGKDMEIVIDIDETDSEKLTPELVKEQLIQELEQIRAKDPDDDDKKKQIVPKEEVKEALGRSPDLGDTFIMRMMFEYVDADTVDRQKRIKSLHDRDQARNRNTKNYAR